MKELFLENQKKDINSSINSCSNSISSTNELDDIYEMLMFTRVKSCYKESLIKILAKIVRHQPLIIIFSFIIGIIFFATPFIFIYIQLFENYTILLLQKQMWKFCDILSQLVKKLCRAGLYII